MERVEPEVAVAVSAQIDGEDRRVIWRQGQLSGDEAWIRRAIDADPDLHDRTAAEIVHALEAEAGTFVSVLITDDTAAHSLTEPAS